MWHPAVGVMRYGPGVRAILEVDQGIADFYRSMIPKHVRTNPQFYGAHVSVVRKEQPYNMAAWYLHEGKDVPFEYCSEIMTDDKYFWLNVRSPRLEEIRVELGLSAYPHWRNSYHLTIANCKDTLDSPARLG